MNRAKAFLTTSGIGAVPVLTLGFFIPLQIFVGNSDEFFGSFASVAFLYIPYTVLLIACIGVVAAFMSPDGLRRYQAVLAALAVLVWLQGNVLVWEYGVLDGRTIEWRTGQWRGILDATVWAVLLVAAISGFRRFGKSMILASMLVLCIQLATAAITAVRFEQVLTAAPDAEADSRAADAIFRFSEAGNVVHIVMDGFQTDIFADIIADPRNAIIADELSGFTLFRENVGVYPYTQLTVPALLGGQVYRNDEPVAQFIENALTGPTILKLVSDNGYQVDIAAPVGLKNTYSRAPHTHAYGIGQSDHVESAEYVINDAAKLLDIALFRSVPHFAKALVYRDELWVFQAHVRHADYLHMQYFSDLAFLDELATRMSVNRETPVYKLMHLMLSHRPTVGNESCVYDGKRATNRANVTQQARCGLRGVASVLRRMRELGIYDNSLIILMADHGAWVPVDLSMGNDAAQVVSAMTVAMAIPVLAIKPPGAKGPLQVSNAPTSVSDVPATIARILGLQSNFPGTPAFATGGNGDRPRRHLTYAYGANPNAEGYLFTMLEYEIKGSPLDADAWRRVMKHPPGNVADASR